MVIVFSTYEVNTHGSENATIRDAVNLHNLILSTKGGGGEIRTLGGLPLTRFPSVRTRPLCDASVRCSFITEKLKRRTVNP